MGLRSMFRRRRARRTTHRPYFEFFAIPDRDWYRPVTPCPGAASLAAFGRLTASEFGMLAERCPYDTDGSGTCPWHDQSCQPPRAAGEPVVELTQARFEIPYPAPTEPAWCMRDESECAVDHRVDTPCEVPGHELLDRSLKLRDKARALRADLQRHRDDVDGMLAETDRALGMLARTAMDLGIPTCPAHERGCPNGGRDCWKADELVPITETWRTARWPSTPEEAFVHPDDTPRPGHVWRTEVWPAGEPFEHGPSVTYGGGPVADHELDEHAALRSQHAADHAPLPLEPVAVPTDDPNAF